MIWPRGFGRAGKGDAGDPRIGDQRRADRLAGARQQMQRVGGDAGLVQQPHRGGGDERRLLGRLGDDGVAGGERGGDLAGEDRQREIPRRDAGEDAAPVQGQLVALAGRAGQQLGFGKVGARAQRVIAQIVDRFPDLRQRRRDRAAAFADDRRHQCGPMALEQVGGAFEDRRALAGSSALPCGCGRHGAGERRLDLVPARP